MSELVEFLLARIAEDERLAETVPVVRFSESPRVASHDPFRVRRECDAKRRIVDYAGMIAADPTLPSTYLARHVLADLATTYSDHPDYRDEWRP